MKTTSWGREAIWGEYQEELILPNLLRLMEIKKGEVILDLGCGAGFFAREFAKAGAKVIGVDIAKELIAMARKSSPSAIQYRVAPAEKPDFLDKDSVDKIAIILAIQNMENVQEVFRECARVLRPGGLVFIVMNHPAFRVPKYSSWGWDPSATAKAGQASSSRQSSGQAGQVGGIMYRRVDRYISEIKAPIEMTPSQAEESQITVSFHRPLQFYFKALNKNGFTVSRLEEWNSHKKSGSGPRAKAEDRSRKEIPLFLFLEIGSI